MLSDQDSQSISASQPVPEPEPVVVVWEAALPCSQDHDQEYCPDRVEALALLGLREDSSADDIARAVRKLSHKARKDAAAFAAVTWAASILKCDDAILAKRSKLTLAREEWASVDTPDASLQRATRVRLGEPGGTPKTVREFHEDLPEPFSLNDLPQ